MVGVTIAAVTTCRMSHLANGTTPATIQVWYLETSAGFALFMCP